MKKRIIIFLFLFVTGNSVSASYETHLTEIFTTSPSLAAIEQIQDPVKKFCELSYFDAYMRREFTELENLICKQIFIQKIEGELLYKQ